MYVAMAYSDIGCFYGGMEFPYLSGGGIHLACCFWWLC